MSKNLMDLPLGELLDKFAAGKHEPGSGSAAALLGLIAAALSRTVIELTVDRTGYEDVRIELQGISDEINNEILPLLEGAFVEDAIVFDRVIQTRRLRNRATSHEEWWKKSHQALSELDNASATALKIARNCIRLAELSITVFDKGFQSARGDSEVAIEAAMSGSTGALSVVYLNLLSFRGELHANKTLREAEKLVKSAKLLQVQLANRMEALRTEAIELNRDVSLNAPKLLLKSKKRDSYSNNDLFQIAKNIHAELWLNREQIWTDADQLQPVHIIDPATTFSLHGYDYEEATTLGRDLIDGQSVEIAGLVDNENRLAKVSQRFPLDVRRFTSAHELGHAVLHEGKTLFRDRALDGGSTGSRRPKIEIEADTFAAFFLMPEVQVRMIFEQIFGKEQFEIDQRSATALGFKGVGVMRSKLPSLRHLSSQLATTSFYLGVPTRSLCEIFGVSTTAMAIRIEELSLIRTTSGRGIPA